MTGWHAPAPSVFLNVTPSEHARHTLQYDVCVERVGSVTVRTEHTHTHTRESVRGFGRTMGQTNRSRRTVGVRTSSSPTEHCVTVRHLVALPAGWYVALGTHVAHSVDDRLSVSAVPGEHINAVHGPADPAGTNDPEAQARQRVAPSESSSVVPGAQSWHVLRRPCKGCTNK